MARNIDRKHDERVFFTTRSAPVQRQLTDDLRDRWRELITNYQAIHEAESVTEIDDATREVALQSIANQPHVGLVRDSFDERAGVRELRRCAAQLIVDCGLPKVFPAIVEDSGIRRKGS